MSDEEIDYLTVDDLLEIATGVVGEVVVRDAGLLAAAAGRPQITVYGDDAYPTFDDKAAALLHSLVRNHALGDGNKRLAWAATRVFCILNGRDLAYTVDEPEQLMLVAAAGELDVPELAVECPRRPMSSASVAPVWAASTAPGVPDVCQRRSLRPAASRAG